MIIHYSYFIFTVVPRIIFDKFTDQDYTKLLSHDSEQRAVQSLIVKSCKKFKFDGIVLEIWPQLALRVDDNILYNLVIGIGEYHFHYPHEIKN